MDIDSLARVLGYIVLAAGAYWLLVRAKAFWDDGSPKLRAGLGTARDVYLLAFFALLIGGLIFAGVRALIP